MSCIYCGRHFVPGVGDGDHIFPAAMGEFANLRRFRDICSRCNNDIGKSEAQLRCGPEGYMERISKPPGRRRRMRKAWRPAMGAPVPSMRSERYGAQLAIHPIAGDPRNVEMPDQIVVILPTGEQHAIPVFRGMGAETIRSRIKRLGINGPVDIHVNVAEENWEWFDNLTKELWPNANRTEFPETEIGLHRISGRVSFTVNDHYFRALAKIAFHYFLCYNGAGISGRGPEFTDLREFILQGGNIDRFYLVPSASPVYFGVPFGDLAGGGAVTPGYWCHLLAADDSQGIIVVYLQLFMGPGYVQPPHYVVLGAVPSGHRKVGAFAHLLVWEPASDSKGIVQRKSIATHGRPPNIVGPMLDTSDLANALYTAYRGIPPSRQSGTPSHGRYEQDSP